ncbi:MAG: PorT family protein [Flavobacteriales bacterium]|nr:PorT family protein [Flavobacteriales bacterium]
MNQKSYILIIVCLLSFSLNAQFRGKSKTENLLGFDHQEFSWGYSLGVNFFTFKLHPNENGLNNGYGFTVVSDPKLGFSAGLMGRWRLNDNFDFRVEPGLHFVQRDLIFRHLEDRIGQEINGYTIKASDSIRNIKSTYLDIPAFINFHGNRYYNTRPYIQTGVSWMVNLQSNEKKTDDNLQEVFRTKTHNFTWQTEVGIEIYFKKFKLTPSVKGIFFFNNEWVADNEGTPDVWANSLKAIYSRAVIFSLKFE